MSRRCEAEVDGVVVQLPRRVHCVLEILLILRGRILSRGQLTELLWPDPDDEPENIRQYLAWAAWWMRHVGIGVVVHHGRGMELPR